MEEVQRRVGLFFLGIEEGGKPHVLFIGEKQEV